MRTSILFLLFLLLGAAPVMAEARYVSEDIALPLRDGETERDKILKMLKVGTGVEVLQESEQYALVRTGDGTEGYVLKRFLTTETPKAAVVARLERENARLQERLGQLEGKQSELQTQAQTALQSRAEGEGALAQRERELEELRRQFQELQEKSQGVIEISAERDRLQAQNEQLTAEVTTLRQEVEDVLYTGAIQWFLAGGGVLLVGWFIGRSARKKKRGYSF